MVKLVLHSEEARDRLKEGVDILANAVKVTLGPKGRNVIIDKNYITPHITKDGVTVASSINLDERVPNMGCTLLKSIAKKTAEEAGDGTTTSIVIAQALFDAGLREIEKNKINSIDIQKGMKLASTKIIEKIQEMSKPIASIDELKNIALMSSNGDEEIANLISNLVYETGPKGNIIVQDSDNYTTYSEFVDGIRFDCGYTSWYFCNKPEEQKCEYENPLILVSQDKISSFGPIAKFVEYAFKNNRPLIIITEELVGEAMAVLLLNVKQKGLKACVVSAPGFANNRKELLEDIAVVTGSKLFGDYTGNPFHHQDITALGTCNKIIIDRANTTFFINDNVRPAIDERIVQIEGHKLLNDNHKLIKDKFDNRIAALRGKVAVVNVGGFTETEVKEKKDRVDDTIRASKAALEEGYVEGSGITYINAVLACNYDSSISMNQGMRIGFDIVTNAVRQVFNQVALNCGKIPEVILSKFSPARTIDFEKNTQTSERITNGYDFRNDVYCNLIETGIIDPTKVLRVALENAVSIVCLMLTTEAVVMNKLTELDMDALRQPKHLNGKQME